MTKQQLNVRIADITRDQIDRLTQHENLTAGEVVMLAVERLYQQRRPAMGPERIKIEFSDDGVFGNYTAEDVDRPASVQNFTEALEAAFDDEYPNAKLEIIYGINDRHSVDGHYDSVECEYVGNLINKVWSSFDWLEGASDDA